jgi:hypothetical protein
MADMQDPSRRKTGLPGKDYRFVIAFLDSIDHYPETLPAVKPIITNSRGEFSFCMYFAD